MIQDLKYLPLTASEKMAETRRNRIGKRRLDNLSPPVAVERDYRRHLVALVEAMHRDYETQVAPKVEQHDTAKRLGEVAVVILLLRAISASLNDLTTQHRDSLTLSTIARDFIASSVSVTGKRFATALARKSSQIEEPSPEVQAPSPMMPVEGQSAIIEAKLHENIRLIKTIPEQHFAQIEQALMRHFAGQTTDLAAEISRISEVSTKRAEMIARDQSNKLAAAINEQRAKALGSTQYVWRTQEDERVRHSHAVLNGKTFSWDSPPVVGINKDGSPRHCHPSEDYNCRCFASPVIPF